jgi:hypothetical protein
MVEVPLLAQTVINISPAVAAGENVALFEVPVP